MKLSIYLKMKRVLIYTIFFSITVAVPRNTYEGWKLYRFWPPTEDLVDVFALLYENTENFDFWTPIRDPNEPVDVAVRETAHPSFENLLMKLNVTDEVQIEYIEKALNREIKEMKAAPNPEKGNINFLKYHRYNVQRLWRKTRSYSSLLCRGVDGNRNFDFHWMEGGASALECSETYAGPTPFSESETAGLRDIVGKYQDQIELYLSIHSYGNYLLYPWGYTSDLPENVEELHDLATQVSNAIGSVYGTTYTIGSTTNVLYIAAGGSDDWAKGVADIDLSYTFELPGGGSSGFDLPASRILEVCVETFEGIKVFQRYVEENFARKN